MFEEMSNMGNFGDLSADVDFDFTTNCDVERGTKSMNQHCDQVDLVYFKWHPHCSRDEGEEIDFDEHLFDIAGSVDSNDSSSVNSSGYDHQTFMMIFDYHQNGVQQGSHTIREAVEKTLEDLEDPTKSLEASLSPLASLDVPVSSLEETIRELEESLRNIQSPRKSPKDSRRRHTGENVICEVCGKGFANESRLEIHKICHTDGKPLVCPHCGKSFKWTFALSRHIKIHTDDAKKFFKCRMCQKSYRFERYLKLHEKNVHEKQPQYHCKLCNQQFISQVELLVHWKTHNQGIFFSDTKYNTLGIIDDLQCSECGRICASRNSLRKHILLHTEEHFTCDICSKTFRLKEDVLRHMQKHQDVPEKPQCVICGKILSRLTALRAHMKTHEKTQCPHKCTFEGCKGNFHSEKSLKRHLYERHKKLRIKCTHCELLYKDKSQLQIHIRRCHLKEEAPFQCLTCQRFFWTKREYRNHMKKHHNVDV